eukprot:g5188.t1
MKMGKVIIVTNAMEPWVETSCRNFLPALMPIVSQIQVIYARSVFDTMTCDAAKAVPDDARSARSPGDARRFMQLRAGLSLDSMQPMALTSWPTGASEHRSRLMRWHHKDGRSIDEHKTCIFETFGNPSLREGLRALCEEIAFEQEISGFYSRYAHQSWKNVISIGDSIFERDAVRRVVINRPTANRKCRTKTAKLLDEPEIDELVAQVKVVHDALGLMVQYDGNLDIEIDEDDLKLDLSLAEKIMDR